MLREFERAGDDVFPSAGADEKDVHSECEYMMRGSPPSVIPSEALAADEPACPVGRESLSVPTIETEILRCRSG